MSKPSRNWRAGYGLAELLRDLFKLADLPAAIADAIRSAIPDFIGDRVRNAIAFHVQQVIYDAVGSARPGSHSLLAKDTDTSDPFAEEALLLARVAHRATIHPLIDLDAPRSIPAGQHTDCDTYARLVLRHPLTKPRPARWRAAAPSAAALRTGRSPTHRAPGCPDMSPSKRCKRLQAEAVSLPSLATSDTPLWQTVRRAARAPRVVETGARNGRAT